MQCRESMDPQAHPAYATLCAAIDAGDDSALPYLADLLEEYGDARAEGLRQVDPTTRPTWQALRKRWSWVSEDSEVDAGQLVLSCEVWDRLTAGDGDIVEEGYLARCYPTRSAALLALADALAVPAVGSAAP